MKTKTCPFCKEKIIHDALVCRYCTRDLPEEEETSTGKSPIGWFSTLIVTAVIVSSSALLVVDFLKERQRWIEK